MDDTAFESFVRTHTLSLMRTAFVLTGGQHAAEDLVQATLTYLYPRWAQVAAADSEIAYVRRSLVNRFLGDRRRASSGDVLVADVPERRDPADFATRVADQQQLQQLLQTLPERQRAAVVLRYLHDLPDDQIAAALDCREPTVRSLLRRGLLAMRAAQDDMCATGTEGAS